MNEVAMVLALLGPSAEGKHREIASTVEAGRRAVRSNSNEALEPGRHGVVSNEQKKAAGRAVAALRRLQTVLHAPSLVNHHLPHYSTNAADEDDAFQRFNADLEWLRQRYQADAEKPLRENRDRAVDWSKREAAKAAVKVLQICGLSLSVGRNSLFVQIAAVIYGHAGADLRKACGTVRRELSQE